MQQLIDRTRAESGSVLITAILATVVMLGLGFALLGLNDVQAQQSGVERTRDRAFNVAESALSSESFALGRTWPTTAALAPSGTGAAPAAGPCSTGVGAAAPAAPGAPGTGFGATVGPAAPTGPAGSATARLQPNLSTSYNGTEYTGASWRVNVCDNTGAATVWSNNRLSDWNYDNNGDHQMWVRAQATVQGKTRAVVGLVDIGRTAALPPDFALVNGSMGISLAQTLGGASGGLLGGLTSLLFGSSDPLIEGRIGIRCGAYDPNLAKNCLGGNVLQAITNGGLLGSVLATNQFVQFPSDTAVSPDTLTQLRSQASATGTYVDTTNGANPTPDATGTSPPNGVPACTRPAGLDASEIWFIEKVGNGDGYCTIAANITPAPAMIVVGSGRVIVRGSNSYSSPQTLNSVVYGLNLQRPTPDATTPAREIVRIDQAARVFGAVLIDGKSGRAGIYPTVDCGLLGLGCVLNNLLGGLLNTLLAQIPQQGPVIKYDPVAVAKVNVFTTSNVVPGTFREL